MNVARGIKSLFLMDFVSACRVSLSLIVTAGVPHFGRLAQ